MRMGDLLRKQYQNEYTDLPWVHDIFLQHHLENLCEHRVVAKAGNRFYMLHSNVATEQSPDCLSMLNKVVTQSPTLTPFGHVDDESNPSASTSPSWTSSVSWSSSTSFDGFPGPKRKCQLSRGQKSVRRRSSKRKRTIKGTRININRAAKRRSTVGEKASIIKEIHLNPDILMLEGEVKKSEEQTDGKEECQYSQGQKSTRKRGRKSKRTTKGTRINIDSAAKRRGAVRKKAMEEKEIQLNDDVLMLESEVKKSEEQTDEKEECQYSQEQKSARKRRRKCQRTTQGTRIYLHRVVKRQGRVCEKALVEELHVNSDILKLEGEVKESEEHTDRRKGHHVVVECHDPITGKKRTVLYIDLDELQDMVNEGYSEQDLEERSIHGDCNQADVLEKEKQAPSHHIEDKEKQGWSLLKQTEAYSKFEHHEGAEAEVGGQEDLLRVGPWEAIAKNENQLIVNESFLKETNSEVMEKQNLLEDHDFQIVKGDSEEEKKWFQPCKRKLEGRQVHQKDVTVTGRGTGSARHHTKDLSAEESQPNGQEMEASLTQDLMLEKLPEVTEEQFVVNKEGTMIIEEKIQGNGCEPFRCNQTEDINIETEMGKPAMTVEENASEEQHNLVTVEESQVIGGIGRCDGQEENETLVNKKFGPSGKLTIEVAEEQKQPQRQQNKEQTCQAEKHSGPNTEQQTHLQEEHEAIVRISPVGHDAEENSQATILLPESFSSAVEEETENIPQQNVECESDCPGGEETVKMRGMHTQQKTESTSPDSSSEFPSPPHFLQQPRQMLEEEKEEMEKTVEHKRDSPTEEGSEEIRSKHTQQTPGFPSPLGSSELKSEEISSQPPLWHWLLKTLSFS